MSGEATIFLLGVCLGGAAASVCWGVALQLVLRELRRARRELEAARLKAQRN